MTPSLPARQLRARSWTGGLIRGLCPRCRAGKVFRGRVSMNEKCPGCGLVFEREQGYFVAAMYFSYAAAVVMITAFYWLILLAKPGLHFAAALGAAALFFLPFVPAVFRYSRVLWMYIDRTLDPG